MPDYLGENLRARALPLPNNSQGDAVATLVHHHPPTRPPARFAVLYVHGWSDYFYNLEQAEFFTSHGGEFYAVDMHGVGRSLRPHQIAGYVPDLREYFFDLDAAVETIRSNHPDLPLVLLAHSQGALSTALWLREQGSADAWILNSPWLDQPFSPLVRTALTPVANLWGAYRPRGPIPISSPQLYERTISQTYGAEWPINDQWRVDPNRPARPGWARAILQAQNEIARGLNLTVPILVLTSDASLIRPWWSEEMRHVDVITDVRRTWHALPRLGRNYTLLKVRGAVHDVFLSPPAVRERAYRGLEEWLARLGLTDTPPPHASGEQGV